ncbi:MAG: hypothetical protein ACR2P4_08500 [Gammaproteobacteria bacterium]
MHHHNRRRCFVPPFQGLIIGHADSQGVALCYNMSPFQGFKNAPLCGEWFGRFPLSRE